MLKNNTIIYDHECPMCAVYTGAFIKFGLLDQNGRHRYAALNDFACNVLIDKDRARHEIALVDTENQEVRYGLDSLFYILGNRFPILNMLFKKSWFRLIMKQLYYFISYNRKVIAPSSKPNANACVPDFDLKQRVLYILLMLYVVALFSVHFNIFFEFWLYWACQVIFSVSYFKSNSLEEKVQQSIHYLGHQITILIIGSLLMLPTLFFPNFLFFNAFVTILVMSREFYRRVRLPANS